MSYDDRLGDYNDVASRMREFFEKYPDGRLRPAEPWRVETIGDKAFVVYEAAAYRTADDELPGVGTAWEPFPGRTPYTKDSELMNAETSAWGRAILAVGAADTKKGIATREEVRNRRAEDDAPPAEPPWKAADQSVLVTGWRAEIAKAADDAELQELAGKIRAESGKTLSPNSASKLRVDWAARKAYLDQLKQIEPQPELAEAAT